MDLIGAAYARCQQRNDGGDSELQGCYDGGDTNKMIFCRNIAICDVCVARALTTLPRPGNFPVENISNGFARNRSNSCSQLLGLDDLLQFRIEVQLESDHMHIP